MEISAFPSPFRNRSARLMDHLTSRNCMPQSLKSGLNLIALNLIALVTKHKHWLYSLLQSFSSENQPNEGQSIERSRVQSYPLGWSLTIMPFSKFLHRIAIIIAVCWYQHSTSCIRELLLLFPWSIQVTVQPTH